MAWRTLLFLILSMFLAAAAEAAPVLMISIDGLRPGDILEAQKRGLKVPNLRAFLSDGAYSTGVKNELPTITYPNHTTLITGVSPALHGITANTTFDPLKKNYEGWYWYASDIRVPTLWDAVHAQHKIVDSIDWPVSAGTNAIDYNIPEYWRAYTQDDLKLLRALSTPGLITRLEHDSGVPLSAVYNETPESDMARARFAAALIDFTFPQFMTVHLVSVDHYQHEYGPGSPEAHQAIETCDAAVGLMEAEARKIQADTVVAIVSDHGFAPVSRDVNLMSAFVDAGLVTLDPGKHKIVAWDAEPWDTGGSAAIMLARPDDQALKDKVAALLTKLASDPANGIAKVIDKTEIAARGGGREPSFWVDFDIGWEPGHDLTGPLVTASTLKGMHGYFPDHKEMRATFLIDGPGVPVKKSLGEIDMRDIAPTLAKLMNVPFPSATGRPLF
jgi:predicted AlkP superfamily pyrophosphatase or phosphodiesterase